jgi:predicted O-linked N-acetylglucosamine transferase (SPINDLY family)
MGNALSQLGRRDEAVEQFRRAIALDPGSATTHHNLGVALQELSRHHEAIGPFREALRLDPEHKYTLGNLLWSRRLSCDWEGLEAATAQVREGVRRGLALIEPLAMVAVSQDPEEQLMCARRYCEDRVKAEATPPWKGERERNGKIRVAYLSADFREHAVAYCTAELFARHDRSRFEVIGVSFGADDGSPMRAALARSFDRFEDVRGRSDADVAALLRELRVDIAVDLMGYTRGCRPGILASRPAPVQVGYLGFPGTSGTDFIDYLIADRFVIPEGDRRHYSEQVVYLPDTYMVNPSKRVVAEPAPTRADVGLPQSAFVFCCFGNNYKVTPEVFDTWMRLLAKVEDSVLWLARDNAVAEVNLRKEAGRRGVDPGRLVFAPFVKRIEEHYARLRLGDLFLDTAYNGHLTSADALWAGLPVLTWAGTAFAGRVAGSLLQSVGLPELIAHDLREYEATALKLATDRGLLRGLRERLERNRRSAPLFDPERFRRRIESAYAIMWDAWQRSEAPRAFSVSA